MLTMGSLAVDIHGHVECYAAGLGDPLCRRLFGVSRWPMTSVGIGHCSQPLDRYTDLQVDTPTGSGADPCQIPTM